MTSCNRLPGSKVMTVVPKMEKSKQPKKKMEIIKIKVKLNFQRNKIDEFK